MSISQEEAEYYEYLTRDKRPGTASFFYDRERLAMRVYRVDGLKGLNTLLLSGKKPSALLDADPYLIFCQHGKEPSVCWYCIKKAYKES